MKFSKNAWDKVADCNMMYGVDDVTSGKRGKRWNDIELSQLFLFSLSLSLIHTLHQHDFHALLRYAVFINNVLKVTAATLHRNV